MGVQSIILVEKHIALSPAKAVIRDVLEQKFPGKVFWHTLKNIWMLIGFTHMHTFFLEQMCVDNRDFFFSFCFFFSQESLFEVIVNWFLKAGGKTVQYNTLCIVSENKLKLSVCTFIHWQNDTKVSQ